MLFLYAAPNNRLYNDVLRTYHVPGTKLSDTIYLNKWNNLLDSIANPTYG